MASELIDVKKETEENPEYEVHIGQPSLNGNRHCIVWIQGQRYEGTLEKDRA